jgi:hypothetical protein
MSSAPTPMIQGTPDASMMVKPAAIGIADTASATRGPMRCAIVPPIDLPESLEQVLRRGVKPMYRGRDHARAGSTAAA